MAAAKRAGLDALFDKIGDDDQRAILAPADMTEAGDTAAAGGGLPAALSVIDGQIAAIRQDLNDTKEAIKAIYLAREATPPVVLPKYRTEEEQDEALRDLKAKEERLLRILDNLTSQRGQAQAQAGATQAGASAGGGTAGGAGEVAPAELGGRTGAAAYIPHGATASIRGCRHIKGIRARIYWEAEEYNATCWQGATHTECICYNGDDLHVRLGFEDQKDAYSFRRACWRMNRGHFANSLDGRVEVSLQQILRTELGDPICAAQYDTSLFDSPPGTIHHADPDDDDSSSRSSHHSIALESDLAKYQSIEQFDGLMTGGVDGAHIWPKRLLAAGAQDDDSNNRLALSKTLQAAFDGPHNGVPTIAIRPLAVTPVLRDERFEVCLAVEYVSKSVGRWLAANLKDGYVAVETHAGVEYHVTVLVQNPTVFCDNLKRYYERTRQRWNS
ncbi:hypothetical protein JKP88DRAFT_320915 [Tribonema minus]|uniref:Uncharacterized protein n=1 Tax=Tribonema minus TaxID=303371 RepID=A0A835Z227_9STRA|nr:hypothetical protein JKP88DRAFT_320915 [Tribonema minus]